MTPNTLLQQAVKERIEKYCIDVWKHRALTIGDVEHLVLTEIANSFLQGQESMREAVLSHNFHFFDAKTALTMGNTILSQVGEKKVCLEANELIEFLQKYAK